MDLHYKVVTCSLAAVIALPQPHQTSAAYNDLGFITIPFIKKIKKRKKLTNKLQYQGPHELRVYQITEDKLSVAVKKKKNYNYQPDNREEVLQRRI